MMIKLAILIKVSFVVTGRYGRFIIKIYFTLYINNAIL